MTLYQLAEYYTDRNTFVATALFENSGFDPEDLSADAAARLWEYIEDTKNTPFPLLGITKNITDGSVTFSSLPLGIYLLAHEGTSGGPDVLPFFVTIPMQEEGAFIYDVTANSKVRLRPSPPPEPSTGPFPSPSPSAPPVSPGISPAPNASPEPSASLPPDPSPGPAPAVPPNTSPAPEPLVSPNASPEPNPSVPPYTSLAPDLSPAPIPVTGSIDTTPVPTTSSKLPYTGQHNWPIPALVILGLLLFGLGWYLRQKNDK